MPVIYTTPVSRADGADVTLLPTDLSVETGLPSLTNCVEGTHDGGATNRGVETKRARGVRHGPACDRGPRVLLEQCSEAHAYSLNKAMKMYARVRTLDQALAMLGVNG